MEQFKPYKNAETNLIYNLLFCDNLHLFKSTIQKPYNYPFDMLFSEATTVADLQKIIDDDMLEPRMKLLAYNKQLTMGHKPSKKELLAIVVEVGFDNGLDVLASFNNGTARYINQTGKMVIWETADEISDKLTRDLFLKSEQIVNQIGPWDKPRQSPPVNGNTRITFLVSDGLYFGEASTNLLFNDQLAKPALTAATALMQYITEKSL